MTVLTRLRKQLAKMGLIHWVAGLMHLKDKVRSSVTQEQLGVEGGPFKVALDASWTPFWRGVPAVSHWEETMRTTLDDLEGLNLLASLESCRMSWRRWLEPRKSGHFCSDSCLFDKD